MLTFDRVYEEHVFRVYAFVAYRAADRDEAEDLTQQVFERALVAWPRFDPRRASVATWLLAIARNLVIDHYRARRPTAPLDAIGEDQLPSQPDTGARLGLAPELRAALDRLSTRDQEILALRFGADLTGAEIAEATGLSLANVQQVLSRGLRRLRDELEGSEIERTRSGEAR